MNSLFGVGFSTPVNVVIAFVVVLLLIGLAAWLVRRFGARGLDAAARSRQPRLAVIDSAAVDGRRKLVIIRRDNVEHLLMIGGPNDVVVEASIVRSGAPATRDIPAGRGADTLVRAMPLPDASAWVAPPEPTSAPSVAPVVRVERERPRVIAEEPAQWPPSQPEPDEPAAPPVRAKRAAEAPAPARSSRTADALAGFAAELAKPAPEPPRPAPPSRPTPLVDPAFAAAAADKNLADMAQRLEQALRQPPPPAAAPSPKSSLQSAQRNESSPQSAPRTEPAPRGEPKPVAAPPTAAAAPTKTELENFEQEMANLLGRSGKT